MNFDRVQSRSLIIGLTALAIAMAGAFLSPKQFLRSYLVAYLFWVGIALGSAAIVMLHHLVGGRWGFVIRRMLESATKTLPLMALLSLPIFFGARQLYAWALPGNDHAVDHKSLYLNLPFFVIRSLIYFGSWIVLAYFLNKWSAEQDRTAERSITRRLQLLSGPGLLLYGLTVTFASIDWVMSLEPHWFSTIYGILFMVGQALSTLAFVTAILMLLSPYPPISEVVTPDHFHDLGNLMLAFVMLWAYVAFSQFLIIWSGNLPEEIPWYLSRLRGGWQWIALFLFLFHFLVPFLLLLARATKRRMRVLSGLAISMIVMRLVDLFWMVSPAFHPHGLYVHWMDFITPVAIGGLWVAMFVWQLKARPLLPLHDPRFTSG